MQINAYPPLAPLVLVLKVYLRSCGLNEVANGGLSSFSLTNMVLAHLMDELRVRQHQGDGVNNRLPVYFLPLMVDLYAIQHIRLQAEVLCVDHTRTEYS